MLNSQKKTKHWKFLKRTEVYTYLPTLDYSILLKDAYVHIVIQHGKYVGHPLYPTIGHQDLPSLAIYLASIIGSSYF